MALGLYYSLVVLPLEKPFHGWRDLGCVDLPEMDPHHLGDPPVSGPEVQEPVGPPLGVNPEQPPELLCRKHKHGAATQKPGDTEKQVRGRRLKQGPLCVCVRVTHPLIEVRDTSGPRTVDMNE